MEHLLEFIHFGLTSQDINSTSYVLSMKQANEFVILPELTMLKLQIIEKCKQWGNIAMITKTHGQPASPSVLGKEMYVFVDRLNKQMNTLINYQPPYSLQEVEDFHLHLFVELEKNLLQ